MLDDRAMFHHVLQAPSFEKPVRFVFEAVMRRYSS